MHNNYAIWDLHKADVKIDIKQNKRQYQNNYIIVLPI